MNRLQILKSALVGGASVLTLANPANAKVFNIPDGDLSAALVAYMKQSDVEIIYADDAVRGHRTHGARGDYTETAALTQLLRGTGFTTQPMPMSNAIGIVPQKSEPVRKHADEITLAAAAPRAAAMSAAVETVVVTAQKKTENIQNVPIAVTALSQQQLTERQIAGGPDLVKEVPNLTFSKTNFTGYNLEIRGIGTQAISVTTDPAVAVAFNDIPFIRNHFFEQEFFDVQDVEVLRGPQGTLYGRNATAGVVDIKSALPTGDYEAMLSADIGNFSNRRLEGMINVPIVSDKLDIRMAGEWTKRDGYTEDQELNTAVDGRDLWSGRLSISFNPSERLHSTFVWERFSEDDDRMRSAKQLCKKDPGPTSLDGFNFNSYIGEFGSALGGFFEDYASTWLSQGCLPTSLYSPSAFETPNGQTLPFVALGEFIVGSGGGTLGTLLNIIDPYASETQPTNLRTIQSLILPHYRAKNDTLEYNLSFAITPELTLISVTGYNNDFLFSTEDFNRFDTAPGIFGEGLGGGTVGVSPILPNGVYCDPQLGCSSSMVSEDLSDEHASQFNQEIRLASSYKGPLNFSFGTNYTHYQTVEDYYVMFNLLTAEIQRFNSSGPGQYDACNPNGSVSFVIPPTPFTTEFGGVSKPVDLASLFGCSVAFTGHGYVGTYIDPNGIDNLDGQGHNYFRSENPYALNSWAGFGEVYYDVTQDLKLTGGLRWTDDRKVFWNIPSAAFELGGGYPVTATVKQGWNEWTGRFNANWSPELDFTDQSMFYASYAHGYKGGGANPPGPIADYTSTQSFSTHPPTFAPEHIEAFEVGTKNTALGGSLTLNGDVFFYNYHGYQISQIVDRTSVNLNFNATVEGAEVESTWEPMPGLKFNFAGGWEDSAVDKNQFAIDLMDRTAGTPDWVVVRPFPSETSNCILPSAVIAQILATDPSNGLFGQGISHACDTAYGNGQGLFGNAHNSADPLILAAFADNGFNPATAPNGGEGFAKNLSGNKLPNMPPFTLSAGAQYSAPVNEDWLATLRADFYWQGNTFARIFNDRPYDSIHGYTNLNLALILNSQNGWDVMAYVKNVFDVTAITGDFLNSDDTALTTNVFVTDPRLFGVRVTKHLDEGEGFWGSDWSGADIFRNIFSDSDNGKPPLWIELGGNFDQLADASQVFAPPFFSKIPSGFPAPQGHEKPLDFGVDWETEVSFQPSGSDWSVSASARYGRTSRKEDLHSQTNVLPTQVVVSSYAKPVGYPRRHEDIQVQNAETHTIIDFMVGKDVGLGVFGMPGTGVLSGGVRYAEFTSRSNIALELDPDSTNVPQPPRYHYHLYNGAFNASRSFRGIGPAISLKASAPMTGDPSDGQFTFDWGANGAVLFGRQKAQGGHSTKGAYYCQNNLYHASTGCPAPTANAAPFVPYIGKFRQISHYQRTNAFARSRIAVVPNIGAFAGISYHLPNAKLTFGYRADEFFGAMDGGIDTRKSENRGFFGPYANISIGIGG